MSFPIAEHDQLADELVGEITSASPDTNAIWHLGGSSGAGKHALLDNLFPRLRNVGLKPIRVSGPTGEHDSAAIAMMQTAVGLKTYGAINGQIEMLTQVQRSWDEKIRALNQWLSNARQDVVLLCDEPSWWVDAKDDSLATETYVTRGREFVDSLWNGLECRRVITGWAPDGTRRHSFKTVPRIATPKSLLENSDHWGSLAASAAELAIIGGHALSNVTPLVLRMLVCIAAIENPQTAANAIPTIGGAPDLVDWLYRLVASRAEHRRLLRTWARLAVVRGTIHAALYQQLLDPQLTSVQSSIVELGLLDRERADYVMPRLVRKCIEPLQVLNKQRFCELSDNLTSHYYQLAQGQTSPCRYVYEIERFHHAVMKGDPQHPIQGEPYFIEQLHAAGWALSYVLHDHRSAIAVFHRAIQIEPTDDYAQHYLAFNLDWLADDVSEIDRHYCNAIDLNPTHPWWWSRWICFLITVGRGAEAKKAWVEACDALNLHEGPSRANTYESLHLWVARLLLHRAQLDFAEQVLNSTPNNVRTQHVGFRALDRLLTALREAERGRGVFPVSIPPSEWWRAAPHLDFPPQIEGEPLCQWNPARVDGIENGTVHLVVGKPPSAQPAVATYGHVSLSTERFNDATLDLTAEELTDGRLLELGFYGEAGLLRIRSHSDEVWRDPDLPPFIPPDPRRYLKKGGTAP